MGSQEERLFFVFVDGKYSIGQIFFNATYKTNRRFFNYLFKLFFVAELLLRQEKTRHERHTCTLFFVVNTVTTEKKMLLYLHIARSSLWPPTHCQPESYPGRNNRSTTKFIGYMPNVHHDDRVLSIRLVSICRVYFFFFILYTGAQFFFVVRVSILCEMYFNCR